ncbi:UNVERIFIED_ORG: uncharacterized protein (DUF488 family) [Xanthobacter viscosus]|jgi:uncharacterized protein (DUF488 family)|uniref:DUF488 domain-containing protein n=1 Tax=Xanthobacter autotrophicus TaxID=280 RepID=A0A6C1KM32_XANAU|nr:DUF488 domain-containing protein [Xanthobacter autotrophicus]TLX44951.1 DUF488 domain-containing protein [Xanthobacter autotrophicus]
MSTTHLFSIGYEQSTPSAFQAALDEAKVELLVDVRAVAASRRPGFSKTALAAGIAEHGVAYVHLRALGTPKEGRLAARGGDHDALMRIYDAHLATAPAQAALEELTSLAKGRRICLLCYERHVEGCHRLRLAQWMCERLDIGATHLIPAPF